MRRRTVSKTAPAGVKYRREADSFRLRLARFHALWESGIEALGGAGLDYFAASPNDRRSGGLPTRWLGN
jgi:hypothetical protein